MARKRKNIEILPRMKIEYLVSYRARRRYLIQEQIAQLHKSFMDRIEHDEVTLEVSQEEARENIL